MTGYSPALLVEARALAETLMTETVTAGIYVDGVDPLTKRPTRELMTSRYAGKAQVKYPTASVSESDTAGSPVAAQSIVVKLPHGSPRLYEGDEVHVTASSADDLLIGRAYRITGSAQAGNTTAHRYPAEEIS